jgi:hypothetical protein
MSKNAALPGSSYGAPLQTVTIPSRHELFTGMEYDMTYDTRNIQPPNVPPPVSRSSLAQTIFIHRYQQSKYISILRYFGLRPDYPVFHGFKIINGAPAVSNTGAPVFSAGPGIGTLGSEGVFPFPRAATAGTMKPPSRFVKALPLPIPSFNPPTYPVQQ